jgi:hypothetical protein
MAKPRVVFPRARKTARTVRSLAVRLAEAKEKAAIIDNRMEIHKLQDELRRMRRRSR